VDDILCSSIENISTRLEIGIIIASWDIETFETKAFSCAREVNAETIAKIIQKLGEVETTGSMSHTATTR